MRLRHAAAAAGLALGATGCQSCHEGKPYTPYRLGDDPVGSATATVTAPGPVAAPVPAAPDAGFAPLAGKAPEGHGAAWSLGGASVPAPAGRAFSVGLEVDVDRDGKPDLLGWARSPDGLRGELMFAPGAAPGGARTVFALPGELAPSGCTAKTSLSLVGPRSAVVDFRPTCPALSRDRAVRYLAIVRWPDAADGRPAVPELGLELRIAAAGEGEGVDTVVTTADKDGDGRPDLVVTLATSGAPKALPAGSASAVLVFFDRAAGLSRDPAEPEATFKASAAALFADARRPRAAAKVAPTAEALRRLFAAVCEEAGHPIVTTSAGPVRCGDLKIDADAALAELEAAVNLVEPLSAAAALGRVDALGASGPRKKDVEKLVAKMLPTVSVASARALAAVPAAVAPAGYGPLGFLANGDLLVRLEGGAVVRADAATLAEAPDPPRAWATQVAAPPVDPTSRLLRVERRCTDATLVAHVEVKADGGAKDVDVPLPIPTPPRCTPAASVPAFPLGGELLAVGAEVVRLEVSASPSAHTPEALVAAPLSEEQLGASRSPDGITVAIPTARGVLVASFEGTGKRAKAAFWSSPDLEKASFCVPANGARRIACVAAGKAVVADR